MEPFPREEVGEHVHYHSGWTWCADLRGSRVTLIVRCEPICSFKVAITAHAIRLVGDRFLYHCAVIRHGEIPNKWQIV